MEKCWWIWGENGMNLRVKPRFYCYIRPKLHHRKWRKLLVTLFRTFSTSPAACWYCLLFFVQALSVWMWRLQCALLHAHCNLHIHTDIWSTFCLLGLYWTAPCWQAVWRIIFKIRVIFGVRLERRKVDKKGNLHENWSIQTLFYSILNISAKWYQNRSL